VPDEGGGVYHAILQPISWHFEVDQLASRDRSAGALGGVRLSSCAMGIANPQNLVRNVPVLPRPYGIRVSLRPGDPFAKLLGSDWQKTHWFFTAAERDQKLEEMARKHEYSRIGDQPALTFEKVENLSESRAFS
jgi:hypothetical protein